MDKKKVAWALMIMGIVLPILKPLNIPGHSTVSLMAFGLASLVFSIMAFTPLFKWENDYRTATNDEGASEEASDERFSFIIPALGRRVIWRKNGEIKTEYNSKYFAYGINGFGLIDTIANWFKKRKKEKAEKPRGTSHETPRKNQLMVVETLLFTGLSILSVGILFTLMRYPGCDVQRTVGGGLTLAAALANVVLQNSERCSYCSKLKSVSLMALPYSALALSNSYWEFICNIVE